MTAYPNTQILGNYATGARQTAPNPSGAVAIVPPTALAIEVTITNYQGMHGRPAAQFVAIANKFPKAEVTVTKDGMDVNGKSILGLMMLAAGPGTVLRIAGSGDGCEGMLDELKRLVEARFGEEGPP